LPNHIKAVADFLMRSQPVENTGNLDGNTSPNDDETDAGQHRAVKRGHIGHLHFFQQVDAHRIVVPLFCQKNFDKISGNRQLIQKLWWLDNPHRGAFVRLVGRFTTRHIILLDYFLHRFLKRKMTQGPTDVTFFVAVHKPGNQDVS